MNDGQDVIRFDSPRYIVVEGPIGVGKTSLAKRLAQSFGSELILEQAVLAGLDDDIVDAIFDFQIRDFSTYAVALHGKPSSTRAQQDWAISAIRKPVPDAERFGRVWERVKACNGAYEMRP